MSMPSTFIYFLAFFSLLKIDKSRNKTWQNAEIEDKNRPLASYLVLLQYDNGFFVDNERLVW